MERVLIFLSTDQGISTGSMRSVIPEENAAMAEEDRRNRRGLVRREAEEDLLQELVRQRRTMDAWWPLLSTAIPTNILQMWKDIYTADWLENVARRIKVRDCYVC
ncbi:hypothetical protein ZWY2020_008775 [Hordeum vulgare]|nr:hypothetical protein ZWY2020_008775 [Hordeum vulgare]